MGQSYKSGNLEQKDFTDHQTAKTFKLSVAIQHSALLFFENKSQRRGIPQILVGSCSHLFIYI